jgi:hypothetical protein
VDDDDAVAAQNAMQLSEQAPILIERQVIDDLVQHRSCNCAVREWHFLACSPFSNVGVRVPPSAFGNRRVSSLEADRVDAELPRAFDEKTEAAADVDYRCARGMSDQFRQKVAVLPPRSVLIVAFVSAPPVIKRLGDGHGR